MKFFCIPASLFCRAGPIEQLDFSQLRLEQVPKEIFKARKHIEELLLNVNSIEELPADLFRCTKIRRLDVSENKIKVVPVDIGALPSLVRAETSAKMRLSKCLKKSVSATIWPIWNISTNICHRFSQIVCQLDSAVQSEFVQQFHHSSAPGH
ncbi:hypothetical protein niasHS_004153 [Heterodera schachtii]|uniref:Uncharacterized protein n=1 Tax=Heterodera schachtii TaxID=97005 RepID=A0ABD2JKR9_HETSC